MMIQDTHPHVKLWHKEFWLMALANLLLTTSVYMQIPVLLQWLDAGRHFSSLHTALSMGAYGVGIFALGVFCSYLVQRYRRNQVCMVALIVMAASMTGIYLINGQQTGSYGLVVVLRFITGATFGLAQMVLSSTLIIDTCSSCHRTEANVASTRFNRFAVALGPMAALLIEAHFGLHAVFGVSVCAVLVSMLFISLIRYPFKAPEETLRVVSLDRFFLPSGAWLFLNLMLVTTALGLLMTLSFDAWFYGVMLAGFLLAIVVRKIVFANAELQSETVTGLLLFGTALLLIPTRPLPMIHVIAPLFVGLGLALIGARFLLFFIKLSKHCQRGTSQSTFFLAWESGVSLGIFLGIALLSHHRATLLYVAILLVAFALLMYVGFTHRWYMQHKNRE